MSLTRYISQLPMATARFRIAMPLALAVNVGACGSDAPATSANASAVDAAAIDVTLTDSPAFADADDASRDSLDTNFCDRSQECSVRPADCCSPTCERSALEPMNGPGGREWARACLDRGCNPCQPSARWVARCIDHRCTIVDLEESSISACSADGECQLRWGAECCQLCHPDPTLHLVSTNRSAVLCEPGDGCDPCGPPPFPEGARAVCVDLHCRVQQP